jgi:hypothetical protein
MGSRRAGREMGLKSQTKFQKSVGPTDQGRSSLAKRPTSSVTADSCNKLVTSGHRRIFRLSPLCPEKGHSISTHYANNSVDERLGACFQGSLLRIVVGRHPKRNTLHDADGTVTHQTPSRALAAGPSFARTRSGSSAVFVAFKSFEFMTRLSRKSLNSKPCRLISTSIA